MKKGTVVKGYKVFHKDFTCYGGFQYEVGTTYTMDDEPICGKKGFHFCLKLANCFNQYSFDPENKVAEIEAFGDIDEDGTKACTNGIRIVRELTWQEVLDLVNTGKNCTGFKNSGDYNNGDRNSGNRNSEYLNSGNRNSGSCNSGDCNSGNWNSGNWNSGHNNCGYKNSGNWNSGDRNSGSYNSGDWNCANFSSGYFNTKEDPVIIFNKPSNWTHADWMYSKAREILSNSPSSVRWITMSCMTAEEKELHPNYMTTEGYLKAADNKDAVTNWWNGLSKSDKDEIKSLPNFDWDIFCQCVGIDKENANP